MPHDTQKLIMVLGGISDLTARGSEANDQLTRGAA
jgi:hypothetical protein